MNRKTILTSAVLSLLAVGQVHADNKFVVTDTSSSKQLMSIKLSDVKKISFADGNMVVTLADKTTKSVELTTTTMLQFEGDATAIAPVVGGADGLEVKYVGGFVSATGLAAPADAAIYNVSGQRVMNFRAWDGSPVSTAELGCGVYILKVKNKSIKFVKR